MDSTIEKNREAMLRKLANRNQKRVLDSAAAAKENTTKIDLEATEKAFLESSPSTMSMRTPLKNNMSSNTANFSISAAPCTSSPILSFDEKADKQIVALATWTNTVIGMDHTEELDLGATTADACRRIQKMLATKRTESDAVESVLGEAARRRYQRIFEKNDSGAIRAKCKKLLDDSGIEESIRNLLSKNAVAIRDEHSVYNDLALQTSLLGTFLCFHPAWLKAALEAIFDAQIDAQPKFMIRALSQFFLERVFSNQRMLNNKKFAQGSGKKIITKAGREALHRHFLEAVMKMMFVIETANSHRVIPNLTRVFTKSSQYKCLDDVFSGLTKQLLTGSSLTFRKAFAKIGFTPNYKQSFIDNYDYQARGFADFSDGLILAKLIETVGELPYGELLLKLRDPAGDRIRKLNNVKVVLQKMTTIGISTEDATPEAIVGGKKEAILALLWTIVGVRVAKEKRVKIVSRPMSPEVETPKKKKPRRSAVHDDMSSEVLKACKTYGRELGVEVMDLDGLTDGRLLASIWKTNGGATPVDAYSGDSLWEKVISVGELELGIQRGMDQSVALFVKMFLERTHTVKMYNEKASLIQKTWRAYLERKATPKMYHVVQQLLRLQRSTSPPMMMDDDNATFVIQKTPGLLMTPHSMNSTINDATFTVDSSRDSLDVAFRQPKTPLRGTFTRHTIARLNLNEVINEEDSEGEMEETEDSEGEMEETEDSEENDETVVPSTTKKRFRADDSRMKRTIVFEEEVKIQVEGDVGTSSELVPGGPEAPDAPGETPDAPNAPNPSELRLEDLKAAEDVNLASDAPNAPELTPEDPKAADSAPDALNSSILTIKTIGDAPESSKDFMTSPHQASTLFTPGDDVTQPAETPEEFVVGNSSSEGLNISGVASEDIQATEGGTVPESTPEDVPEDVSTTGDTPEDVAASESTPMDVTQPVSTAPSTSTSSVGYEMTDEQKATEASFRDLIQNQQRYVENYALNVVITEEETAANTPELRRILRETKALKRKQVEVAKRLGAIERHAQAIKNNEIENNAFIIENSSERSDAGHDDAIVQNETSENRIFSVEENAQKEPIFPAEIDLEQAKMVEQKEEQKRNAAATSIQKLARGFLARRRFAMEIRALQEKMIAYNRILAQEMEHLDDGDEEEEKTEKKKESGSVEKKLQNCTRGLVNENLHVVHIAATIIDRLTDLVPSLLSKFVVELNGIKPIYEILAVADQGFAYTSILQPLLRVLQKSLQKVPEQTSDDVIRPLLQKLSPRLVLLMCKHAQNPDFFIPIVTSLIAIARRFPNKKESFIDAQYAIRQTMRKVTDQVAQNHLTTLRHITD